MNQRTKLGLATLAMAIALGALGDGLLRSGQIGLNAFLWIVAVVGALLFVERRFGTIGLPGRPGPPAAAPPATPASAQGTADIAPAAPSATLGAPSAFPRLTRWMLLPALLCAAAYLWRDSPVLVVLDTLALGGALILAAMAARGVDLRRSGFAEYGGTGITVGLLTVAGPLPLLLGDIEWQSLPRGRWADKSAAVARGLLFAVPLLLLFGGLFVAADAVFAQFATRSLTLNMQQLFSHLLLTSCLAWLVAGYVRTATASQLPDLSQGEKPSWLNLGAIETGVILGLLNLLFLTFVLIQFRYFFGGAALVEASTGLTYAEYARKGFFELIGVTGLVLPMLLLGHWLLHKENPTVHRLFRWLAGALVIQLFVIMASAVQRMLLYVGEFGLTELRLYSTAFMVWLAILFIWFCATVMRGQRGRFPFGAVLSGLAMLAVLHLLNPDALIARVNMNRLEAGKSFDAAYATSLSADAVPILLDALPKMNPVDQGNVTAQLRARWLNAAAKEDWRSWNMARSGARVALGRLPK